MIRFSSVWKVCGVLSVIWIGSVLVADARAGGSVAVELLDRSPQALFALGDLKAALKGAGHAIEADSGRRIALCLAGNPAAGGLRLKRMDRPESFAIRRTGSDIWVVGADPAGLMYGGLELAEVIQVGGLTAVKDTDQEPYMAMRGTKFNIPLDVRTPSYTDVCDAAQQNIGEMWSLDFWRGYIDSLARYRYNYISLWNLHPFPSMVKVPDYPDVALADVKRSKGPWKEFYSLNGNGFCEPEILANAETLKKMTIEEKMDFWREVMRYGKERNVDFYVVTWNIFVYGTEGKYGITDRFDNPVTIDYFRKSVKQMFVAYPDLAGIGLTTGENFGKTTFQQKEDWAFATYGQGVLDAAREMPGRRITFIHRQHMTGAQDIARTFQPLIDNPDIDFIFSFKYAKAHVMSSTTQPYHQKFVEDIGDLKTIWTLRNDDNYLFRWGAPDFVREFIQNIPYEVSRGFYYGSDQYIWGREFLSLAPYSPRQLEVDKHWYHWMLWGRLGYNPQLDNRRLIGILQARFKGIDAATLFQAWQEASMIYPTTTGFHWGALDFQWYIEACKSIPRYAKTDSGFNDVNFFIKLAPHATSGCLSIPDYVKMTPQQRASSAKRTPPQVAEKLMAHSQKALTLIQRIDPGENKELRETLLDIEAMAYLGMYYSYKIAGSTSVALYRAGGESRDQQAAITALTRAAEAWKRYTAIASSLYKNPLWTNRVGYCDWDKLTREVMRDIDIAREPSRK